MSYTFFVGIDIAMETAAVHWHDTQTDECGQMEIKQSVTDYRKLARHLQGIQPADQTLIVMEATGNYWLAIAIYLHAAGFHVSVVNPQRPYHFAKSFMQRTKTDLVDAQMLCRFAHMIRPDCWTPPPAIYHRLQQRLALREDFVKTRTQHKNRLHASRHNPHAEASIQQRLQQQIDALTQPIDELDAEIQTLIDQDHDWAQASAHLQSISGIGPLVAAWILVATQNFAFCSAPEQAAAFAGLVPHAHQSGKKQGSRQIGGGHPDLRRMLYMAAGSAIQHNPIIRDFYQRLVQRGKVKKLARVAAARKLMHIAYACAVKGRDFDPNYATHFAAA